MEFYTYLTLEDLNSHTGNNRIITPVISDYSPKNLECLALEYIKDYDPNQLIEFSAWLNMIYSVKEIVDVENFQNKLLKKSGWPEFKRKILIYRYTTLSLVGLAAKHIKDLKGTISLSDQSLENCGKYLVALAILNCHPHNEHDFIRQLIRDYPNYLPSIIVKSIYLNRILKSYLLLSHQDNTEWTNLLSSFTEINNFEIKRMVKFIASLWQYYFSSFDINRSETFLIYDSKFNNSLPVIKHISTTPIELGNKLEFTQDMELYRMPIETVRHPILMKDEGVRYPIDLVSIIDTNGALAYEIFKKCYYSDQNGSEQKQYRIFKENIYSSVSEDIFIKIIKKIFSENFEETRNIEGYPDCIIQNDNLIFLFEYTTAEPGFMSLFSEHINKVKNKYSDVLVARKNQSQQKAKLKQISNQIDLLKSKYRDKNIFPIMVTDNHFGDFDLLNEMGYFLTNAICEQNLQNLQEHKLTILSMDDIFNIFQYEETNSLSNLAEKVQHWNSDLSIKKDYFYSFSVYLKATCNDISKEYKAFCDEGLSYLGIKNKEA